MLSLESLINKGFAETVRFRSAAVIKNERSVEFVAFLFFFCFKRFEYL